MIALRIAKLYSVVNNQVQQGLKLAIYMLSILKEDLKEY